MTKSKNTKPQLGGAPDAPREPEQQDAKPLRLISKLEVLDRVGVSFPALWQWMRVGEFPAPREVGGKVMWIEHEVEAWITSRPQRQYKTTTDSALDKQDRKTRTDA